jgi:hypothetical protein
MNEPTSTVRADPRVSKWLIGGLIVVAIVFATFTLSRVDRSADLLPPEVFAGVPVQVFDATGPTIEVVPPSVALRVPEARTVGRSRIEPLPEVSSLGGYVALTATPAGGVFRTMWTLGPGGSLAGRSDLPVGIRVAPRVVADRFVAFTDGDSGYVIDAGLVGEPVVMSTGSVVIPSDATGRVWFVSDADPRLSATEVGMAPEGSEVVGVYKRPFRAIPDGLERSGVTDSVIGVVGVWTPGGVVSLSEDEESAEGLVRIALSASPDLIRSRWIPATALPALAEIHATKGGVSTVCIARISDLIAAVSGSGTMIMIDPNDGARLHTILGVQAIDGIGWATPDQLVFLASTESGTEIHSIDTRTGIVSAFAVLSGSTEWTLAASASSC